jgi:CHAD domain-containing protein
VKARPIAGLDRDGTLAGNLRPIVAVRLEELRSFVPRALDPDAVRDSHDMRIAAKRLRYVLELAERALGQDAAAGAKLARSLQDSLGEIHDLDELLDRLRGSGRPLPVAIARVTRRRAKLFERFVRDWERLDLSPIERLQQARADGAAP